MHASIHSADVSLSKALNPLQVMVRVLLNTNKVALQGKVCNLMYQPRPSIPTGFIKGIGIMRDRNVNLCCFEPSVDTFLKSKLPT